MKILALDTTANTSTVAVLENESLLGIYTVNTKNTHSETLLPMVKHLYETLRLTNEDIDAYAVSNGPGSFTGVRIGVALVKGIAFGKNIPCVSVSTLDELAENLKGLDGIIVPCMDARRAQVYTATYKGEYGQLTKLTNDRAIAITELADELREYGDTPIYLSGDGYDVAKRGLSAAGIKTKDTPALLITENAYSIALIAKRKYDAGEYGSDLDIAPTYLRMPQAERERLERLAQENK